MSPTPLLHRAFLNGQWTDCAEHQEILSPTDGTCVARAGLASSQQMNEALAATQSAFALYRHTSRYIRSQLLMQMAQGIEQRRPELIQALVSEAGKPHSLSDGEITRAICTFTTAAEEAKRWAGEVVPLDIEPLSTSYSPAQVHWVPRGPVLAITPFNFPLNLVAHKVAPALAAGCTVLVKPAPQAPGTSRILAEIFEAAATQVSNAQETIPLSALQVFSCTNSVASLAVKSPVITTLSFTGSESIGWMLQEQANRKLVILDLGGNAGVILHADADLKRAAARCAFGSFAYAGQVCISVQRIFVQEHVALTFEHLLLDEVKKLKVGDPAHKDTLIGPMIDPKAAERVMQWIAEAREAGGQLLCGGQRHGNFIEPTVMKNVPETLRLAQEEVFGPVVLLDSFKTPLEAIERLNASRFGLQAGIFTDSQKLIQQATQHLEVGGLLINDVPTYRSDVMPYGGIKNSGLGREGIRYAMEHFSERKTIVTWKSRF